MANSRLSVLVIGGGIAGLSAGIALRPFADVTVLENASELKEIGAAVGLGPGVVRILRSWGIEAVEAGAAPVLHINLYTHEGKHIITAPFQAREKAGEDLLAIHRADLHKALLDAATSPRGTGTPVKVLLGQKVASVDPDAGLVLTVDGRKFEGDVVVGADGIRSIARRYVTGSDAGPVPVGESVYRLFVKRDDLLAAKHPLVKSGEISRGCVIIKGPQRKIVAYPIRDGSLLTLVCYVPDLQLNESTSDKWTAKGSVDSLLKSYETFDQSWKDILALGGEVDIWQMRDMKPLTTWVKGKTIIIGDAAHPMLPHQAGGAMTAIEDAEALGFFLRDATAASVTDALTRVFRVRFKRASQVQYDSHVEGIQAAAPPTPDKLLQIWNYKGAYKWEEEHPDMVLKEGEDAIFKPET